MSCDGRFSPAMLLIFLSFFFFLSFSFFGPLPQMKPARQRPIRMAAITPRVHKSHSGMPLFPPAAAPAALLWAARTPAPTGETHVWPQPLEQQILPAEQLPLVVHSSTQTPTADAFASGHFEGAGTIGASGVGVAGLVGSTEVVGFTAWIPPAETGCGVVGSSRSHVGGPETWLKTGWCSTASLPDSEQSCSGNIMVKWKHSGVVSQRCWHWRSASFLLSTWRKLVGCFITGTYMDPISMHRNGVST
mmetsp:Transcript_10943/g.31002  ORF Transcript_10943/g.31002 Transcript_10943/m.31002 type:complete len:247 (+) Transcript_10943:264-1004(+)